MSGSSVRNAIREQLGVGDRPIARSSLDRILDAAVAEEPGTDVRGEDGSLRTIDPEELDALVAEVLALGNDRFEPAAIERLAELREKLPRLSHPSAALDDMGKVDANRPVFLDGHGWPRLDPAATELLGPAALAEGFHRLALLVKLGVEAGGASAIEKLPLGKKERLVNTAASMLAGPMGRDNRQLRSAAFTVLWELVRTTSSGHRVGARAHEILYKAVEAETDVALARDMVGRMCRTDYLRQIDPAAAKDVQTTLFDAKFEARFPVEAIMDSDGYIQWNQACGSGENFFRSFLWMLDRRLSIHGAKFKVLERTSDSAKLELTFPEDTRQRLGLVAKGVRLAVRPLYRNIYEPLGQPVGFGSFSHSNIGENQEGSYANARIKKLSAKTPQVALIGLCAGLDGRNDLERLGQGKVTVITTYDSSTFQRGPLKDEEGIFEGEKDSEDMVAWAALIEGLSAGRTWKEIEYGVKRQLDLAYPYWGTQHTIDEGSNYVFPTLTGYRNGGFISLDPDGDGVTINDVYSQDGVVKPAADEAHEYQPKIHGIPFEKLDGSAIMNAALDTNVATHYSAFTRGRKNVEHRLAAGGFFDGTDRDPLVRIEKGENPYTGAAQWNVRVNSRIAHASREAIETLVFYAAIMEWADANVLGYVGEVERKLMALTFAAFHLNYDSFGPRNDGRVWDQLLAALNLPADLSRTKLCDLLGQEHHDYAGNMKIVEAYKKEISPESLRALEKPEVGRGYKGIESTLVG